ncbi:MAG: alpha/beta-type small acid-soluble spore protein [Oscillospiraceae bacterium]|nr:alpha/beta-type small acid-soluble spore protein [Oscillospiraceae bacterium]
MTSKTSKPKSDAAKPAAKKSTVSKAAKTLSNARSASTEKSAPTAKASTAKKSTVTKAAKTMANARNAASGKNRQSAKNSEAKTQSSPQGRGSVTQLAARQTTQAQLQRYKTEASNELGINKSDKLTRKQAGQIGGRVVQKMVAAYEKSAK